MSEFETAKPTVLMRVTGAGEIMVTEPCGRMRFMGPIKAIGVAWVAIRRGWRIGLEE
jgi:hypothetical protein